MSKILVAGANSYPGKYILEELDNWKIPVIVLVREPEHLNNLNHRNLKVLKAELTESEALIGVCNGIDTVISIDGITTTNEGYYDIDKDFLTNVKLLKEAERAGVRKFIYVSHLGGDRLHHVKIAKSYERFEDLLKASVLEYTIIRPNGFFSDILEVLNMAEKGRVVLFGNGESKLNPIHGADFAEVCVRAISQKVKEISVGGPDILTQIETAEMALSAWNKPADIIHLPEWIRSLLLNVAQIFLPTQRFYSLELFLKLMARDNIATRFGAHRLQDYFSQEIQKKQNQQ